MTDNFTASEHRDLSREERRLLEWLLMNGDDKAAAYTSQLPQVRVVSRCACGCPTLDLALGERKSRTVGASTILADAVGHSPEGVPVDVILHAREGELSELEVVSHDATKVFSMPTPETLRVV
jgi:hypothetical protein